LIQQNGEERRITGYGLKVAVCLAVWMWTLLILAFDGVNLPPPKKAIIAVASLFLEAPGGQEEREGVQAALPAAKELTPPTKSGQRQQQKVKLHKCPH
jgi:hypothetical protein